MFSAARHPEQGALNKQACGTLITSMGAAYPLGVTLRTPAGAYPRLAEVAPRARAGRGSFWAG